MEELQAIEMLREVMLGEQAIPQKSAQEKKAKPKGETVTYESKAKGNNITPKPEPAALPNDEPAYITNDDDITNITTSQKRRSRRVRQQLAKQGNQGPQLIAAAAIKQANEQAYNAFFAAAVLDEETGESLEYRDLIKKYKYKKVWNTSFANELGRLAQGIREVKGTNMIHFTAKSS